jgi:hypothetical protein
MVHFIPFDLARSLNGFSPFGNAFRSTFNAPLVAFRCPSREDQPQSIWKYLYPASTKPRLAKELMVVVIFSLLGLHDISLYEFQPITGVDWKDWDAAGAAPAMAARVRVVPFMVKTHGCVEQFFAAECLVSEMFASLYFSMFHGKHQAVLT